MRRSLPVSSGRESSTEIILPDGTIRHQHSIGYPILNEAGDLVEFVGTAMDTTEQWQARADVQKAFDALRMTETRLAKAAQIASVGELAASIAHEVNQPLAAVVANGHACLRWLAAEPPNLTKAAEAVTRIVRDGKDAGDVVQRIRSLFKRAAVAKVALNVNEVIDEVLHLLDAEMTKKRVIVETDLAPGLAPVLGDRVQLQQLMLNLLLNGIEAMDGIHDRPRQLMVRSMRRSKDVALIEIRDHGIGLADPDKAFEAFFTTKENGLGMGLAICRSIIDAHGGQMWASTENKPGTTFSFTLPFQPNGASELER